MHVLVINLTFDDGPPDIHGPFRSVTAAKAYAEQWRIRNGLPGPSTPENNDAWTDEGWYFAIVEPRREGWAD